MIAAVIIRVGTESALGCEPMAAPEGPPYERDEELSLRFASELDPSEDVRAVIRGTKMFRGMLIVGALGLASCAATLEQPLINELAVRSFSDQYTGEESFGLPARMFDRGPSNEEQALRYLVPNNQYMLIASKKTDSTSYETVLSVELYDTEWRFYKEAWQGGEQLQGVLTDRKLLGCSGLCTHKEDIYIPVDKEWLEDASKNGASFKLLGRGGSQIVSIEPAYAQLFLQELEERSSGS